MSKLGCTCGASMNDDNHCYYAYLPDADAEHAIGDHVHHRELWECPECGRFMECDGGKVVATWTRDIGANVEPL